MSDNSYRVRNLSIAAVLALLAALLTMMVVSRASGGTKHETGTTSVLVATRDLGIGTSASEALASGGVAERKVSGDAVPGAVADGAALRGLVVLQPIFRGEQITANRFGPSGAQGLRSELRGPLRVLQVPGDSNQLLAGTLRAGDHVDVVASVKKGTEQSAYARMVLRNLLVLQAPDSSGGSVAGATDSLSATVQLTDAQAQTLFYVLKNGDWSFALRPASRATNHTTAPATAGSVLAGS
jgi:Flp pilus assembly protein CpaB